MRRGRVYGPYKRGNSYRIIVVTEDGGRSDLTCESESEAQSVARDAEEQLKLAKDRSVKEAIDAYEVRLRSKGNKPRSITDTLWRLEKLLGPLLPRRLRRLAAEDCQDAYTALAAKMATDSHRNILAEAKTWARWCVKQGWIGESPLEGVEGVGARSRGKEQLRQDEARRFMDAGLAMRKPGATAAVTGLLLGMRAGEIVSRTVRDLDDKGRLLWIPCSKTPAGRRVLVVPAELRPALLQLAVDKLPLAPLFGDHLPAWVRQWSKKVCKAAGVPYVCAHGLRGTHATLALDAGNSAEAVARSLGHASPSVTTEVYALPGSGQEATASRVCQKLAKNERGSEVAASEPREKPAS